MKKLIFTLLFLMFPSATQAACDLSVEHIRTLAQSYLDANYAYGQFNFKKPKLIVSSKRVYDYYAEELHGVITIYPKEFADCYCDQHFDGLTPFLQEIVNHEYVHYLDEKMHLSRKINTDTMSEKTAHIGEHVFKNLLWPSSYTKRDLQPSDIKKYEKLLSILKTK
ncbi:MAG: hypothetical protein HGA36_05350 [Candidatus Moranbacteria bacterium]|nr:hypothetical protein [Candidatus Moranbacteria bacterium]